MFIESEKVKLLKSDKYLNDVYAFDQCIEKIIELKKQNGTLKIFNEQNIIDISKIILKDFGFENLVEFEINDKEYSFVKNFLISFSKKDFEIHNINAAIHEISHFLSLKLFKQDNSNYHDHLFLAILKYLYEFYNLLTYKELQAAFILSGEKVKILKDIKIEKIDYNLKNIVISDLKLVLEDFSFHNDILRYHSYDKENHYCYTINKKNKKSFLTVRKIYNFEKV